MQQATIAAAASTTLNGVDVSSFQDSTGSAINWTDVAAFGEDFAAIKATEGNYYINKGYAEDAASAIAAGLYVQAYHFANPHDGTGAAQASYAVTNAGNYHVGGQYLPLMLDLEYNPYTPTDGNVCYGLSPAQMVSWIASFMTEATKLTGAAPVIYTPANWWDACTGYSAAFSNDVLWVPAYGVNSPGTLPAGWNTWTLWQYTSVGRVSGISGDVDLDYFSGGPQAEQTEVNTAASSVQIHTLNALAGQQVSYTATGLPPGLTISATGLITGTPTAVGTYQVTVTPSSSVAVLPATVSFTWDVTTAQPAAYAVGAEGKNGVPLAQAPQLGAGWQSLGGVIAGPPAVAAPPNPDGTSAASPLFIATGTNKFLYIRSVTTSWQKVGPVTGSCLGSPAALITGSTLLVACEGTNHALYYNTATVPASGLPTFTTGWTNLGGTLTAGPTVAMVGGTPTFFVRGTGGRIYTRTLSTGFTASRWTCIGSPAAALQTATGISVFACQGTNHQLYEATNNDGAGWTGAVSLGGSLIGGPAIAATSEQIEFFAEGTTHAIYERTATSGWTGLGSSVVNGVGAAGLN